MITENLPKKSIAVKTVTMSIVIAIFATYPIQMMPVIIFYFFYLLLFYYYSYFSLFYCFLYIFFISNYS